LPASGQADGSALWRNSTHEHNSTEARSEKFFMPALAAARRRLKVVAAHMPAIDLGWIVAVSALASVCASLGLYAAAVWRQWRRDVYRAQFVRTRETF